MLMTVKELMTPMPHTIGHDIEVSKAKSMMVEYKCHHLPVLDGGRLVGILSDRDVALVENVPNGGATRVEQLMGDEPFVVDPDQSLDDVVKSMLQNKIHSVIVSAKAGSPWGIFTSTDALKYFVK